MTLNDILPWAEEMRPSAYSAQRLTEWINDLEAAVWSDVLLNPGPRQDLDPDTDGDRRLLLPGRWRRLYTTWLGAMVDYANGEYSQYDNELTQFNACMDELSAWYARRYAPADAPARRIRAGTLTGGETLTVSVPAGAAVLAVRCRITEAFDGEGGLTLGTEEDPALVLDSADTDPATPGTYITRRLTVLPPRAPLLFAAPEGSTEGEATLHLLVQLPAG
ncbi:MAG: hypothetical protein LUE21_12330 [Oscillospiraceae bacterium]|nr:hypothetical protein [Oscillospiraceae bacterium]